MEELDDDDSGTLSVCSGNEGSAPISNARQARNMAEKQRRDTISALIKKLSGFILPIVPEAIKLDKINILRQVVVLMRLNYAFGKYPMSIATQGCYLSIDWTSIGRILNYTMGDRGFYCAINSNGRIIYLSDKIHTILGHRTGDLLGTSIFNIVFPEDRGRIVALLNPDNCIIDPANDDKNREIGTDNNRYFKEALRRTHIRLSKRMNSRREQVHYLNFIIEGKLRLAEICRQNEKNSEEGIWTPDKRTTNDIMFVGVCRLMEGEKIENLSSISPHRNEYITRHLGDGRIIYCDERIGTIAGYFPKEVFGTSAFKFMHRDDVRLALVALREMYSEGNYFGKSCYRLLTKNNEFIYLRTHGYLELDKRENNVVSFICINTLVTEEEGIELIANMKLRYSAQYVEGSPRAIQGSDEGFESETSDCCSIINDGSAEVEDDFVLEEAINNLVSEIPSSINPIVDFTNVEPNYIKAMRASDNIGSVVEQIKIAGIDKYDFYHDKCTKTKQNLHGKKFNNDIEIECMNKNDNDTLSKEPNKKVSELARSISKTSNRSSTLMSVLNNKSKKQSNSQQLKSIKRSRDDVKELETIPVKRKVESKRETLEISIDDSKEDVNDELDYSGYIETHSVNEIIIEPTENQFIDIDDQELLEHTFENNPEIVKLLTNLSPSMNFEETSEDNYHLKSEVRNSSDAKRI